MQSKCWSCSEQTGVDDHPSNLNNAVKHFSPPLVVCNWHLMGNSVNDRGCKGEWGGSHSHPCKSYCGNHICLFKFNSYFSLLVGTFKIFTKNSLLRQAALFLHWPMKYHEIKICVILKSHCSLIICFSTDSPPHQKRKSWITSPTKKKKKKISNLWCQPW